MKFTNLLFLFLSLLSCAQTKNSIDAVFIESIYKQSRVLQDDKQIENDNPESTSKYLYLINKKKDSVILYNSTELMPILFFFTTSKAKNEILFKIKKDNENKDFKIIFNDYKHSVSINQDVFSLNVNYFNFLKVKILKQKNVLEFVDFSEDMLSEYSSVLQKLRYISSNSKYKNKDFRIIKALFLTKNEQTDNQFDKWEVIYEYDSDKLLYVKMFNKNETRFEKKLVTKNNFSYLYHISTNTGERSLSEENLKFDIISNMYHEEGSYLQVGINRETFYKRFLNKEKRIRLENFPFSPEVVRKLFTKYLP